MDETTPDGRPLRHGKMCTCAVHCTNRCETDCCGEVSAWCNCWCHAEEYQRLMRPATPAGRENVS
jgi:hypothetical protein